MPRYLIELNTLSDWQSRLGDPVKHWKRGSSAMELAVHWRLADCTERGLPDQVAAILDTVPELMGATLRIAIPERRTPLPGGNTASQSDLWALLDGPEGPISLAVEGKALEPFDKIVTDWLGPDPSPGKRTRLDFLCRTLGLSTEAVSSIRYQLLHRTASAVLEAQRWGAAEAVMLVQRFTSNPGSAALSWPDFVAFSHLWGQSLDLAALQSIPIPGGISLHIGWIDSPLATDAEIAATVTL